MLLAKQNNERKISKMKKTKNIKPQVPEVPKAPKTIKVKTLIVFTLWLISLAIAVYGGWALKAHDTNRVQNQANKIAEQLKENQ